MAIPLEDNFTDVIGKAQRGLGLSDSVVAARAGVDSAAVHRLRAGEPDGKILRLVAPVLGLDAGALEDLAGNAYTPAETGQIEGLAQFNTPFGDMTVNSYLIWDPESKQAAAFDTGSDCTGMFEQMENRGLQLQAIFLTHTHGDHVYDLDRLREATGAPAYVSDREPIKGAEGVEPGRIFSVGSLRVTPRLTWGHSPGGFTWVVDGLAKPIAVVGDALFAGSMGGGMASYQDALRTNREAIFTLPGETILCPGHGPMTTVAQELAHNPFFAQRASYRGSSGP